MSMSVRAVRRATVDALPAGIGMRLRAFKNRDNLYGLHMPATYLSELVPKGSVAVDVGAANGLYAYFMSKNARAVYAFEPNPAQFRRLARVRLANVTALPIALSDVDGTAALRIPKVQYGEASLEVHEDRNDDILVERVRTKTLDSFGLRNVGFAKIDVEGHELSVLRGAERTLRQQRPTLLIELEERHSVGVVRAVADLLLSWGYASATFIYDGAERPLRQFEQTRHQSLDLVPSDPKYVANFLFR